MTLSTIRVQTQSKHKAPDISGKECTPQRVLGYLARYISGGPISDQRIVAWEKGKVTFLARSLEKARPGEMRTRVKVTISETEFVRRWAQHVEV